MNIACTACSARYGVADEKLIGKRVKITCKRCGTVLIVDGNVSPPTVSPSTSVAPGPPSGRDRSSRAAARPQPAARPPDPPFTVAFADGRQEQGDIAQIVRWHRAGQLGQDGLVWREGMPGWLNPWDVPEIAAAFRKMGYARPTPAPAPKPREDEETTRIADSAPLHAALFDDDEQTQVVDSSRIAEGHPQGFAGPASSPVREDDEVPTHVARSPLSSPHAAQAVSRRESARPKRERTRTTRRESRRPPADAAAPAAEPARRQSNRAEARRGQDLFAQQAHAGSEAEALAVANALSDAVDEPRLTGARNENSVLFSLDSLMQKELRSGGPPRRNARLDESLLVDSGHMLPGGGGLAPALTAPDFNAPITSPPPRFAPAPALDAGLDEAPAPRRSRAWLVMVALLALGALGGAAFATGLAKGPLEKLGILKPPAPPPSAIAAVASAETAEEPPETASATASASAAPEASAAGSASGDAALPAPPPTGTAAIARAPAPAQAAAPVQRGTSSSPSTKEKEKEKEPTVASFAAGTPFDAQSAKTALVAAAGNASSCKEPGGATGTGRVSITFASSGRPTSVAVTGDLAGTAVGSCVARLFRGTRVPAFSGEPVTVSKTFSVQ